MATEIKIETFTLVDLCNSRFRALNRLTAGIPQVQEGVANRLASFKVWVASIGVGDRQWLLGRNELPWVLSNLRLLKESLDEQLADIDTPSFDNIDIPLETLMKFSLDRHLYISEPSRHNREATFDAAEYHELRLDLEQAMFRVPAKNYLQIGPAAAIDPSQITDRMFGPPTHIQERLIQANLIRRHRLPGVQEGTTYSPGTMTPKRPDLPPGQLDYSCPLCRQYLPAETFRSPEWEQHVSRDLCPYTCVAEGCPIPFALFSSIIALNIHLKIHHEPNWRCILCDNVFLTEKDITAHISTTHEPDLLDRPIKVYVAWSKKQSAVNQSCPLCWPLGHQDFSLNAEHAIEHAYKFAFCSLPGSNFFKESQPIRYSHGINSSLRRRSHDLDGGLRQRVLAMIALLERLDFSWGQQAMELGRLFAILYRGDEKDIVDGLYKDILEVSQELPVTAVVPERDLPQKSKLDPMMLDQLRARLQANINN